MKIKWFSVVRVLGLLLVLLYHFFQTKFPGGFIGVDILFTFSGYLVTALFIDEYTRTGGIDLLGFARRRFYRILPPVVFMVLVILPLTLLVKKDFVADIGHQVLSTLGFTTNIYELITGGNYESQFIPHLFLHTWSLAIEVQFYLFWGLVVAALAKKGFKPSAFRGSLFFLSALLFALSFGSLFGRTFFTTNFSSLYFSSLSRPFSFFLGSLFATLAGVVYTTERFKKNVKHWRVPKTIAYAAGCVAMLVFLAFLLEFNHQVTYLFGFALASFFTALLIYVLRVLHEQTGRVMEPRWLTTLAELSYVIYLFHWPLYVIFSQLLPQLVAIGLAILFSVALAYLSVAVIEPMIAGKPVTVLSSLSLNRLKQGIYGTAGLLAAMSCFVIATAPTVGAFEQQLLVSSLVQADTNMDRTHTLTAGDATAISDVLIIGDSVTLRASQSLTSTLAGVELDAAVSRSFADAYEIFQNHITSNTLAKTVVIAVGVNSVYNYQADIAQFITALPAGHRLVLVTPYNIKDGRVPAVRDYELKMAEQYPYVAVADWYQAATQTPDIWAGTDGVHFSDATTQGAELYTKTIQEAITQVARQPEKSS